MVANRSKDTAPERRVRSVLHARGLRYRVHFRPLPEVRRTADLVFTRLKVAIFIDGCFWHGCPDHFVMPHAHSDYWASKIGRNQRRDQEIDAALRAAGWLVLRFWEHEDPGGVASQIERAVKSAANRPSGRQVRDAE
jgi:DNA mismatch endonuclease (patch repair protein)